MRAGNCTLQQTLTTEAASVLKHSLSLARRRGHAQLTPLHVAATLLASRGSLLKTACLKSQQSPHQSPHYPLQSRALELCFNVALNRLPTTPTPLLHNQPSLSNALIAALKRAQAHQRRGCIEQQNQQPLLAVKVELEQLIISILDDPSVSRVMREAGFSSTAVKNNIEDYSSASSVFQCYSSSGGVFSSPSSPTTQAETFFHTHFLDYSPEQNPVPFSPTRKDLELVVEVLLRKKRKNTVIVGDSVLLPESLVTELMKRMERGEISEELKSAHFIKFQFSPVSLRFMKREDVEMNLVDLKKKVDSLLLGGGGAIIYTGDLRWAVDSAVCEREGHYSSVNHLVKEMGKLLSDYSCSNSKVWLVATANYQTYIRCQMKQPSLEIQWGLQAVSVPSGGLGLSLHASCSAHDSRLTSSQNPSRVMEIKPEEKLTCCAECTSNCEKEVAVFTSSHHKISSLFPHSCSSKDMDQGSANLPSWLQPHAAQTHQKEDVSELRRKWNKLCQNLHHGRPSQKYSSPQLFGKSYSHTSSYPSWLNNHRNTSHDSVSLSFIDSTPSSIPRFRRQNSCTIEFNLDSATPKKEQEKTNLIRFKDTEGKDVKISLALGDSLFSNSENFVDEKGEKISKVIEENVPWQYESISSTVQALINSKSSKKATWLLIEGDDSIGKMRLGLAIAEGVFGSTDKLFCMKLRRGEKAESPCEILEGALRNHEKKVILLKNVELAETQIMKILEHEFESGKAAGISEEEKNLPEKIIIVTRGGCDEEKMNRDLVIQLKLQIEEKVDNLLENKRKAEWDLANKAKIPRIHDNDSSKKVFSRQSSSNTLDLNLRADEDDHEKNEEKSNQFTNSLQSPSGFLESIEHQSIFNLNQPQFCKLGELFLSKIERSFGEVFDNKEMESFSVDERVLEEILNGCHGFLNSLFEKWLKDVFQTSLRELKIGGKKGMTVRLCLGGQGEEPPLEGRFLDSNLPNKVRVSLD